MADEQYRWLDSDAAEHLLRGEPLDAVDDVARAHAARLAEALAELASPPPPTSGELPGEASALAAFRAARTDRDGERATVGGVPPGAQRPRPATPGWCASGGRPRTGARPVGGAPCTSVWPRRWPPR
ncbi:hypothetical protein ACFQ0G_21700 [Streptomyces chiangmaiensis]